MFGFSRLIVFSALYTALKTLKSHLFDADISFTIGNADENLTKRRYVVDNDQIALGDDVKLHEVISEGYLSIDAPMCPSDRIR